MTTTTTEAFETGLRAEFEAWYLEEVGITLAEAAARGVADLAILQSCYRAATESAAKQERQNVQAALRHAGLTLIRTERGLQVMAAITDAQAEAAAIRASSGKGGCDV